MDELDALVAQVPDEVLDYIEELETKVEEAELAVAKAEEAKAEPAPDTDVDPIEKALNELPEDVANLVRDQKARLEKAEKLIEEERLAKANETWISKARGVDGLIDNPEEFGSQLREVAEINSDLADAMVKVLQTASERFAKADLYKELGRGVGAVAGSAEDKIAQIAKSLQEADPALSKEEAEATAWERNPELYEQHVDEKRAALREV